MLLASDFLLIALACLCVSALTLVLLPASKPPGRSVRRALFRASGRGGATPLGSDSGDRRALGRAAWRVALFGGYLSVLALLAGSWLGDQSLGLGGAAAGLALFSWVLLGESHGGNHGSSLSSRGAAGNLAEGGETPAPAAAPPLGPTPEGAGWPPGGLPDSIRRLGVLCRAVVAVALLCSVLWALLPFDQHSRLELPPGGVDALVLALWCTVGLGLLGGFVLQAGREAGPAPSARTLRTALPYALALILSVTAAVAAGGQGGLLEQGVLGSASPWTALNGLLGVLVASLVAWVAPGATEKLTLLSGRASGLASFPDRGSLASLLLAAVAAAVFLGNPLQGLAGSGLAAFLLALVVLAAEVALLLTLWRWFRAALPHPTEERRRHWGWRIAVPAGLVQWIVWFAGSVEIGR